MNTLNKRLFFEYGLWAVIGLLILIFIKTAPNIFINSWIFTIAFLYLLLFPGWILSKIFKITLKDWVSRFLIYFVLSLAFYFVLNFLAITFGFSLNFLSMLIFVILILLFIIAILLNLGETNALSLNWKDSLKSENIYPHTKRFGEGVYYFLPIALGIFVVWLVSFNGPSLDGDPYLHLSIMRKALDSSALSPRALAFTKTQMINPAYVYPAWHMFLGFLAKTFSLNIFQVWSNILIGLTIISIFCWYYLSKVIFEKKSWTILALSFFLIFTVYGGPGYLFTRLGVPDTFAQFILLPLGLAFSLKYIFDEAADKKFLILSFLSAFILLVLHGPHYFYLLISIAFFGILYALSHFRDQDYKLTMSKFLKVFLIELIVVILVGAVIELRSHTLSAAISEFNKSSSGGVNLTTHFTKFPLVYKYGFLLLPLILIFAKSKRLLFIIATMLLAPLVYWTPLSVFFSKTLSGVFTNRLMANTAFYFFVFALIFGSILMFKDRIVSKLSKNFTSVIIVGTILIGVILVIIEEKYQLISDIIYKIFYAKPTNAYVNNHAWVIFAIIAAIALVILIIAVLRKSKTCLAESRRVENGDYQNPLFVFLLMVILAYILITPTIVNIRYQLNQPKNLTGEAYFQNLIRNDQKALGFLKAQMPKNSVILAAPVASKGLPTLVDQYMAYNVGSSYEKTFKWVFDGKNPDSAKAEIVTLSKWAIEYIYLDDPVSQGSHFRAHPDIYQKIYAGKTEIYQIIR